MKLRAKSSVLRHTEFFEKCSNAKEMSVWSLFMAKPLMILMKFGKKILWISRNKIGYFLTRKIIVHVSQRLKNSSPSKARATAGKYRYRYVIFSVTEPNNHQSKRLPAYLGSRYRRRAIISSLSYHPG